MQSTSDVVVVEKTESDEPISRAGDSRTWQGERCVEDADIVAAIALAVHRGVIPAPKRQHLPVRI